MSPGTFLFIASDHAGFTLKQALCRHLESRGWQMRDLGANSSTSCDYPLFADALCREVLHTGHKGILLCGSGLGMSMAANRHKGIRAALCTHEFHASVARTHNDSNVLCLGERVTAPGMACILADIFLATEFEGGRHQRRINLFDPA